MADIGLAALEKIHAELMIDEIWTTRGEREFSWIGHRLQQTVTAARPFEDVGFTLSRLGARCVVVEGVSTPRAEVLRTLSRVNRHAVGSAYTYWPSTRSITSNALTYVHDDTLEWRVKEFAAFTLLQLSLAETEADWLADRTGGTVAIRDHPIRGRRAMPDEMLAALDRAFAPAGSYPSKFANEFEMQTIADIGRHSDRIASLGGSEHGVAFEASFAKDTSLTMMTTEEPHRRLGNGLTTRLSLPLTVSPEEADRIAAALNAHEASGSANATHYGAWCWDTFPISGFTLAYQSFMPNRLYQSGIALILSYAFMKRAQWADRILNEKPSATSVWETLARRYGVAQPDDEED